MRDLPIDRLKNLVGEKLSNRPELRILEAGCGSLSHLTFNKDTYFVGIDISEKQLQRNTQLNEKILADLQEYQLPCDAFDAIVCWDVLEHLSRPELALEQFVNGVMVDGLIILKLPNVLSLKGLVTKYFPYSFHKWFYRVFHGRKSAGQGDTGPFKTFLRFSIAPSSIRSFASTHHLKVMFDEQYDATDMPYYLTKTKNARLMRSVYIALLKISKLISFNKLGDSEIIMVLQKQG